MNFGANNGSEREKFERRYKDAGTTILIVALLSFVNIVLLIFGSDTAFLFSATVPYIIAIIVYFVEAVSIKYFLFGISFILVGIYALCAVLYKKHYAAMVAATIFICIDTLVLGLFILLMEDFSGIADIVFHILIICSLVSGTAAGRKLKKLPPEEPEVYAEEFSEFSYYSGYDDSEALRIADTDAKQRVFLETYALGHHICYRRVGRVNELIIDGYVYAEYEKLIESDHVLSANLGGHEISAGYDAAYSKSFISVDGVRIKEKARLW